MNRYNFLWAYVDPIGNVHHRVDAVMAENETEAKKIAVLIMRFYTDNDNYTENSIGGLWNVDDVAYYTMEEMQGKRERWNGYVQKAKEKYMKGELSDGEDDI